MNWYMTDMPAFIRETVSENFNCEDIALSFYVSSLTDGKPPLLADFWAIKTMTKLYSPARISGQKSHKSTRDNCVDSFADSLGLKQSLEPAKYVHSKPSFFECGANAISELPVDVTMSERHEQHVKLINQWKAKTAKDIVQIMQQLFASSRKKAYVNGLIQDTPPWKERWSKPSKSESREDAN